MLVGPLLLLLVYYKTMFPGLTNADAMDYAQLGRNLSSGRGFVTSILRPLALTHGNNPLAQPDITHGPLYPLLLALAFGVMHVKDTTVSIVSGVFYLLTIPVIYFLGARVFDRAVGLLAALVFTVNALMLEYAASGLPITLFVFLTTLLLLAVFNIAAAQKNNPKRVPRGQYILAGLLVGLLYLTDPIFIWIAPIVVAALVMLTPERKVPALVALLVPMGVMMLPWMVRNAALTGNPIFGLRGMEIWMNTKGYYPGYLAYRQSPSEIVPSAGVFKGIVQKILLGVGQIIQAFPQVTASWILAFFLPGLLFRFSDSAVNALRRILLLCLLGLAVGSLAFVVQMPLFVAIIPAMLVFSVAYLIHLTQQAKLRTGSLVLVTTLVTVAISFPLVGDMVLRDKQPALKELNTARSMNKMLLRNEAAFSDQPWIVAWYADRPAIWIPADDRKIGSVRRQFAKARWLFLTDKTRTLSPEWGEMYNLLARWNDVYIKEAAKGKTLNSIRIAGKEPPLLQALDGFVTVPPTKDGAPSVVIAAVPEEIGRASWRERVYVYV